MRFRLSTLFAMTTAVGAYVGLHVAAARIQPAQNVGMLYWYMVPTDLVSIVACFLLFHSRVYHRRAVRYGIVAGVSLVLWSFIQHVVTRCTLAASAVSFGAGWLSVWYAALPLLYAFSWAMLFTALLVALRTRV